MRNKIKRKPHPAFTVFELVISIIIIVILVGAMVAMLGYFSFQRELEVATINLVGDLIQTQQFARVQRNGYKYFALYFVDGLGPNATRQGYKIITFNVPPFNPFDPGSKIIKSSDPNENPEFLENTFFGQQVSIATDSEINIGEAVVFTLLGSATNDGLNLLNTTNDEINLTLSGNRGSQIITIQPLTGYVQAQ